MIRWILSLLLLGLLGCGEAVVDHSADPEMFALSVKEQVHVTAVDAQESDEPADTLEGLVLELEEEELSYRPTGDYLGIYQELHSVAREAYEAALAANGRPANLNQHLDELVALADQLPGEVREIELRD